MASKKQIPGTLTPVKFTVDRQRRFLEHFAKSHRWYESAEAAGVTYDCVKTHERANSVFAQQIAIARRQHMERIEKAIQDRGIDGWLEPKFHNGKIVGAIRRYSDDLLKFYARRRIAAYRNDTPTIENNTTVPVQVNVQTNIRIEDLSQEARDHLRFLIEGKPIPPKLNGNGHANGHSNGSNGHAKLPGADTDPRDEPED